MRKRKISSDLSSKYIVNLKSLISWYIDSYTNTLLLPRVGYKQLAEEINMVPGNKGLIGDRYIEKIIKNYDDAKDRQTRKIEAIYCFLSDLSNGVITSTHELGQKIPPPILLSLDESSNKKNGTTLAEIDLLTRANNDVESERKITDQLGGSTPLVISNKGEFKNMPANVSEILNDLEENKYRFRYRLDDKVEKKANALRIVGADSQCFSVNEVIIDWTSKPYTLPPEMEKIKADVIANEKKLANENNADCHDGLNTRLFKLDPFYKINDWEHKSIKLELGPVRWYDYLVANKDFPKRCNDLRSVDLPSYIYELSNYIKLKKLTQNEIIDTTLTNIIDTTTTIITQDGYILYSKRSSRTGAAQNYFTSAVAENIHPILDGLTDGIDLELSSKDLPKDATTRKATTKWAAMNPVFYTVVRGINEELSPKILKEISCEEAIKYIKCLGISFDLNTLHPDLLFIAFLPMNFSDVDDYNRIFRGKDFQEGKLKSCLLSNKEELDKILGESNWTGGGKASVLRALEYLDSMDLFENFDFNRIF